MKKEKKELVKNFKMLIEDIMDNYEEYTDEEKAKIKEIFQKVADLNTLLDKYDLSVSVNWDEYVSLCNQYFSMFPY